MSDDRPIGLFDSGIGGLTVARAVIDALPNEDLVYVGDTARVPWGNRAPATIRRYSVEVARTLAAADCKLIVVACNTASAWALDAVRDAVGVPVIDVISPVVAALAAAHPTGRVGVIGTRGTVGSRAWPRAFATAAPGMHVVQQACPLFVPLAEEGWVDGDVPRRVAETYLADLLAREALDAMVLGCTHYPVLRDVIGEVVANHSATPTRLYDSATHTARAVAAHLEATGTATARQRAGRHRWAVTDDPEQLVDPGRHFLGQPVAHPERIEVVAEGSSAD